MFYPIVWQVASSLCGIIYFTAWSVSFYPQLLLNYRRKSTKGLSPDFVYLNPIGFLGLFIWCAGALFSKSAREEYARRHDGHYPQVSFSDLAFAAHALTFSTLTLLQHWYYVWLRKRHEADPYALVEAESRPLLIKHDEKTADAPTTPSRFVRVLIALIAISAAYQATQLYRGKVMFLDVLYYTSAVKLVITITKYIPQLYLNYKLQTVQGFAITTIFLDLTGGIFSLLQLVISAVFIDRQPAGIIANPGKLGMSGITFLFDFLFIWQHYVEYPEPTKEEAEQQQQQEQ
ncbi:hypothetical protein Q8F55_001295 [Vanrija albida]|uniref:Cystinosin n=1 Tax=Vanrija albida TaxID=181172 RepID=A0ABR3QGP1_9TREE